MSHDELRLTALPLSGTKGFIIRAELDSARLPVELVWAFGGANGMKGQRGGALVAPCESGIDVADGFELAVRYQGPAIEGGVDGRGGDEAVGVMVVERLKTNMRAGEDGGVGWHYYLLSLGDSGRSEMRGFFPFGCASGSE